MASSTLWKGVLVLVSFLLFERGDAAAYRAQYAISEASFLSTHALSFDVARRVATPYCSVIYPAGSWQVRAYFPFYSDTHLTRFWIDRYLVPSRRSHLGKGESWHPAIGSSSSSSVHAWACIHVFVCYLHVSCV